MQTHSSDSAYRAQAILSAWETGDTNCLRQELERVDTAQSGPGDAAEMERLELLAGIAEQMRGVSKPFADESARLYCSLLQHLAGPRNSQRAVKAANCWAAMAAQEWPAIVLQ